MTLVEIMFRGEGLVEKNNEMTQNESCGRVRYTMPV